MTNDPSESKPKGEFIEIIGREGEWTVIGPPAAPIAYGDLLRVFEKEFPPETAAQMAADMTPAGPGTFWTTDILFGVAELSPEHAERIAKYLGWTKARLLGEIANFHKDPGAYTRSSRAEPSEGSEK
jgi:hypothetical protein